ncbi:DUF4262 domain-containing protein [Erythrobacter ani]|uniref:DUF4262 domain-containing protein n=1 Tax=Erythrobacter ani TaxID=2827235 RepID=A0ABS6SIM1_9SPHN|nr:DUF4262 domain-containing protein [Erythrobacter ani]MBV7264853.1 DUF4262 domain-containing protein [Erythrobacter ani]
MSGQPLNEFEERILQNIADHGCQVNHVFDPDGASPRFSYSVGLPKTVGQPEVIVFGLKNDVMHSMINALLDQCRSGLELQDGLIIDDLLDDYECVAKKVLPENIVSDWFASAIWYERYRTGQNMSAAFQIVWPGVQQRLFPWEATCDETVIDAQPALYERAR